MIEKKDILRLPILIYGLEVPIERGLGFLGFGSSPNLFDVKRPTNGIIGKFTGHRSVHNIGNNSDVYTTKKTKRPFEMKDIVFWILVLILFLLIAKSMGLVAF